MPGSVGHSDYAITWRTYLQSSFAQGDPAFHQLMNGAVRVKIIQRRGGDRHRVETEQNREAPGGAAGRGTRDGRRLHSIGTAARRPTGPRKTAAALGKSDLPVLGGSRPVLGVDLYALSNYPAAEVQEYGSACSAISRTC